MYTKKVPWYWLLAALLMTLFIAAIILGFYTKKDTIIYVPAFNEYIKKHGKTYNGLTPEYEEKLKNFIKSMETANQLNANSHGNDELKAQYGQTVLSDLSLDEFRKIHLSDEKISINQTVKISNHHILKQAISMKAKEMDKKLIVDWRQGGLVGPVKDQGMCGACWAFSTVDMLQVTAAKDYKGSLQDHSVQQMIDCAGGGNKGCDGGDPCRLLDWLNKTKTPISSEESYPLQLATGKCKTSSSTNGIIVEDYSCITFVENEEKLIDILANHGPVTVAVNALTWQHYMGGVIKYECSGKPDELNHAVEIVGYNYESEVPYYIVKNSWGPEFGENGYLRLAIGYNTCGLATEVAFASVTVK